MLSSLNCFISAKQKLLIEQYITLYLFHAV